jgi:predicted Zn-dependent protease
MRRSLPVLLALFLAASPGLGRAHESTTREIADLSRRLTTYPADVEALLRRAELLRANREWTAAEADLDSALALAPGSAVARLCRGALELDRGRPSNALPWLDAYAALHPRDPEVRRLRARALLAIGRPAEAAAELAAVLRTSARPTPEDFLACAAARRAAGEPDERVLAELDEGVARLGEAVSLELAAIELELALGRPDQALARLDRIAPRYARREVVLERRAAILAAAGRPAEARATYAVVLAELESLDPAHRQLPATAALEARTRTALAAYATGERP